MIIENIVDELWMGNGELQRFIEDGADVYNVRYNNQIVDNKNEQLGNYICRCVENSTLSVLSHKLDESIKLI